MTYNPKSEFLQEMLSRGFLQDCTDMQGLDEKLLEGCMPAYIGFDATADSLHIGSLIQIMMLRWLQKTGHKPIPLMGGGTTKIGDPSGKDESRQLITTEIINENINGIQKVFEKYLSFGDNSNDAKIINNAEWLDKLNYIEFLRDIGKHFTINRMISMESVKLRLDREQPLTFLEFNYITSIVIETPSEPNSITFASSCTSAPSAPRVSINIVIVIIVVITSIVMPTLAMVA